TVRRRWAGPQTTPSARQEIAQDTIENSEAVVQAHAAAGASKEGKFYETLPDLSQPEWQAKNPGFDVPRKTKVVVADSFDVLRQIIEDGAEPSKTAVLNLASDIRPGGGWNVTLCETQEEALCYSSTLFATLDPKYYPW